ncbi:MAG TPA: acyl-CoA dehydrogenase family protein [Xanthomonadales bacterium]|nr:acyl-CoA dehydrogenase family protein [Xanthomonadales bacterium]
MDFQLTEEQTELRDSVRRYARERLLSVAEEIETSGEPPSRELIKEFADMGYLGVNIPEAHGGLGLGNLEALIVIEELGRVSSAVGFPVFESCVGPVRAIERFASEELRDAIVPAVCRGEKVVAIAMSEPAAGSALTDLTTRATIEGDEIVLNGNKRWCSGGGHADGYLVYCRFSDDPGAKSIGAVYVEKDAEGLSFGLPEHLMGFRGVPSSDIFFDNVRLPISHQVLPAGGFKKLMAAFDLERCGNATMALAQASAALDDVTDYVQERRQFGRPIVDFQAVQIKLAEMKMQVEASRLLIWRAAVNAESGFPDIAASSIAKCYANEIAREVTGKALQLMGGYGYSKEYPMERRFRDAWGWGIAGGAIDIQKINIASAMIGRRFNQRA